MLHRCRSFGKSLKGVLGCHRAHIDFCMLQIVYEAYGTGGTGFIMECLTDNVNRSATGDNQDINRPHRLNIRTCLGCLNASRVPKL